MLTATDLGIGIVPYERAGPVATISCDRLAMALSGRRQRWLLGLTGF